MDMPGLKQKNKAVHKLKWKQKLDSIKTDIEKTITIHGVARAFEGLIVERAFWAFLVAVSVIAIFISGYPSILRHLTRNVIIVSHTKVEKALKLPSITLCNTDKVQCLGKQKNTAQMSEPFSVGFSKFATHYDEFCILNGHRCLFEETFTVRQEDKACITFNPRGDLYQTLPGPNYGVELTLFVNNSGENTIDEEGKGISVTLHDFDTMPQIWFDSFDIGTGLSYHVILGKDVIGRKEHLSQCLRTKNCDTNKGEDCSVSHKKYTFSSCLLACKLEEYRRSMKSNQELNNASIHDAATQNSHEDPNCLYTSTCLYELRKQIKGNFRPSSSCNCPKACEETKYRRQIFIHRLKLNTKVKEMCGDHTNSSEQATMSLTRVRFYFPKLEYDLIEEKEAFTLAETLTDIIGHLNLALGSSLIGFVELTILIITGVLARLICARE